MRWSENAVVSLHWWIRRLDDAWCTAVGFAKAKLKLVIFLQQKRLLQFGINGQGHSFTELYIKALFWLKRETSLSAKWINSLPPCYIIWNLKIVIVRENIAKKESYHWRYYLLLATCNRISWILFTLFTVLSQCIQFKIKKKKKTRGEMSVWGRRVLLKVLLQQVLMNINNHTTLPFFIENFHIFVASLSFCCWHPRFYTSVRNTKNSTWTKIWDVNNKIFLRFFRCEGCIRQPLCRRHFLNNIVLMVNLISQFFSSFF